MKRIAGALFLILLSIPSAAFAQSDKPSEGDSENKTEKISKAKDLFVGTWRLFAIEEDIAGKKTIYPMGKKPFGYLMYDSTGHMALQLMNPDRPSMSLRAASKLELDEIIINGFDAYSGTYSINEEERSITYQIECSVYPTIVGTAIKRNYELTEDQLIIKSMFTNNSDNTERTRKTIWKRVK